jgi:CheY-like chemotaxis protein
MDDETRSKIFEPFFTTKERGTGLGLATVYGIVKQSGGEIVVDTTPDEGAVFTVYLPRVDEEVASEIEPERPRQELRSGTVLLVEDEAGVRQFVTEVLRHRGLDVLVAADAEEALVLSQGRQDPIDVLVTDVVMPAMNGRELARRLVDERPGLRVLFISGYAEEAIFDDYTITPSTAFLAKPFSGETLLATLGELLTEPVRQT